MWKRPSLRALASRVKSRLSGPAASVGGTFLPEHVEIAEDFREIAEQAFKLFGAGVVQSWEGALAELGRVAEARFPEEEARALVTLWSDALVGAEQPVQTLVRVVPRAVDKGIQSARQSKKLSDLTAPLTEKIEALPEKVAAGWAGTCAHLAPLFARAADPAALEARFARGGEDLRVALSAAAADWRRRMDDLPTAPSLSRALFDALDEYQGAAVRAFEGVIDRSYRAVAEALNPTEPRP